jgi:hypothetical protein
MPLGKPGRICCPGRSLLDPAVTGVGLLVARTSGSERRIGEEVRDIGVERD